MKLARVQAGGAVFYAAIEDGRVFRLAGGLFDPPERTGQEYALDSVRLLAPLDPPNIVCVGLNYKAHAAESGKTPPEQPLLFLKATTSLCGPGDAIELPAPAPNEVDYEAELAIVIGKKCKNVPKDKAFDVVLGYTCANDVSARDCQLRIDGQWTRGKSFDTFCPLGPAVVTGLDPDNAPIRSRLNGREMQCSNTSDLIFSVAEIVSYCSRQMTLLPGTVILTGTPSGVGDARTPPVYLRPGDVIEVEIDGIGTLRNPVR